MGHQGIDHGGWGSWPLKICMTGKSQFLIPTMSNSFTQKCCFRTLQVSELNCTFIDILAAETAEYEITKTVRSKQIQSINTVISWRMRLVSKMEGNASFWGAWKSLMPWPDWPRPPPYFMTDPHQWLLPTNVQNNVRFATVFSCPLSAVSAPDEDCSQLASITSLVFTAELDEAAADSIQPAHVNNIIRTGILVDMPVSFQPLVLSFQSAHHSVIFSNFFTSSR